MAFRKNKVRLIWNNNFAYVVGVIATDGNLSPDLRHIHITSKDYEMITNCKKCLKISNTIGKKARGGLLENKKYYVIQFGDKNFFEFLLKLGLTPKKSKTISELKIPKKYFSDFFRDCIDGDGSISISNHPESKYFQYKVRICSASKKFLDWILKMCKITFTGIKGGSICKLKNSSIFILSFGKKDSIIILNKIYSKNVVCLSRKKKIALKIINIGRVA